MKKQQEESTLEKLGSWYQDGEQGNKLDGGDGGERSVGRGHGRADEGERRKSSSRFSDHDLSQSRTKGKDDKSNDRELEKALDRDSRYSERRETNQEKDHGSSEQGGSQRRRWDDPDAVKKAEESNNVERSSRERIEKHRQHSTGNYKRIYNNTP